MSRPQLSLISYTGYTQNKGAVSKLNKKFISHLTRAKRAPSAAATVQVSHALPAVRFSCLLWGQFPRWCRSRKRLSVCSVLGYPDLWLQCSVSFVQHGLEKTHHACMHACMHAWHFNSSGPWQVLYTAVTFQEGWNFPNVIDCIDGKHIRFNCPTKAGYSFYNYKHFFRVVLQGWFRFWKHIHFYRHRCLW